MQSLKKKDGTFVEVQIKARSKHVKFGDAALFAGIQHVERPNYWFVFYSERISIQENKDIIWIMSSKEFLNDANQNKNGKNIGKSVIWFNGKKTKYQTEHVHERFKKYLVTDFNRILIENP